MTEPDLNDLQDQLSDVLDELRAAFRALAERPLSTMDETPLRSLVDHRDSLTQALGRAVAEVVATGQRVAVRREPRMPPETPKPIQRTPTPPPPRVAQPRSLAEVLAQIERPVALESHADVAGLVHRLGTTTAGIDSWLGLPKEQQRRLLALCASYARHAQEHPASGEFVRDLATLFHRMTQFGRDYQPGFVFGLKRDHAPQFGSWIDDAVHWWTVLVEAVAPDPRLEEVESSPDPEAVLAELQQAFSDGITDAGLVVPVIRRAIEAGLSPSDGRLVRLLEPHSEILAGASGLKTLKQRLREASAKEERPPSPIPEEAPLHDWPLRSEMAGLRVIMVGGEPREERRAVLQRAFGFTEMEWEGTEPRRIESVANRIRGGSVQMLILLRDFIKHATVNVLRPACRDARVPMVLVESGYGMVQIRAAIERFWQSDEGPISGLPPS